MKFFKVKSKTNKFPEFEIGNNGLGYLVDEIVDFVYDFYKINVDYKNLLIRPVDSSIWYKVTEQKTDSDYLLIEDYVLKTLSPRF